MIVQHPSFPNVQRDVPEADVEAWVASGWLKPDEKKAEPTIADLRAQAADLGIDLSGLKTKADILAAIEAHGNA